MSLTPIFDAALADAPRNIWQASNIFPQPAVFQPAVRTAAPSTPPLQPAYTGWSAIRQPIFVRRGESW